MVMTGDLDGCATNPDYKLGWNPITEVRYFSVITFRKRASFAVDVRDCGRL
jgi:hypothetical protein